MCRYLFIKHAYTKSLVDTFTYLGSSVSSTEKEHRHAANEGMDSLQ